MFVPKNKRSTKEHKINLIMLVHKSVISQCLSLLPTNNLACPIVNYDMKKLTNEQLVKLFITAQLDHWKSYPEFDIKMHANPESHERHWD